MRKTFNNLDFGPIISMGASPYGEAPAFPRAKEHPRLLFTKDMIPNIKRALADPRLSVVNSELSSRANSEYDGILGIPYYHTSGRKGIHNYDADGLLTIDAKAFSYAVFGNTELGYQAIDAIQNYILTLNIRYIYCDQCRDFGNVLYTVAKVYDWCYDLLTDDEKHRLVAGVINYVLAGDCSMPQSDDPLFHNYGGTKKMEIGFPPSLQNPFTGHGAEGQLTQHYMSGAIAFYDEYPDWWEYVASRYFNTYIPTRNAMYQSRSLTQGVSYGASRQAYDLWAAFTHKVLFGKNPHDDTMLDTLKYAWLTELPDGSFWSDGDNFQKDMRDVATGALSRNTLIMAALYRDAGLLAQRLDKFPNILSEKYTRVESIVYASELIDLAPSDNRQEGYSPITYRPLYMNTMIARREWGSPSSPAVYMKGGERTTANHEHRDIGSFQIFYRELLTRDSGIYDFYGSPYSTGTVSHNGVLVYNPEKAETVNGWYTGGQRFVSQAKSLDEWLSDEKYRTAEPEGASYSVKDGRAEYAYIASNIAPAYDSDVEYLSRRMLSVFTGSEDIPLIFACYDNARAASPDYTKSILLHTDTEPKIDGGRVTLEGARARLVTHYFSDRPFDVVAIGGEERDRMMAGKQMPVSTFRGDGWKRGWGRVEVRPALGVKSDEIIAVMYASDKECESTPNVRYISDDLAVGVEIMGYALLFIRDISACPECLSIDTDESSTYMISGLCAGSWVAEADGYRLAFEVREDERFAKIELEKGKITLKKA